MKRNSVFLLAAGLALFHSVTVRADGQAFDGLGITLGLGAVSGVSREVVEGEDNVGYLHDYGHQSGVGSVGIAYAHTFGTGLTVGNFQSDFNLRAVLTADLNSAIVGSYAEDFDTWQISARNLKSFAIEPGVLLGRTSLGYLKAGYWLGDLQIEYGDSGGDTLAAKTDLSGWSVGAGVRTQINNHVSLGVEVEQLTFKKAKVSFSGSEVVIDESIRQLRGGIVLDVVF